MNQALPTVGQSSATLSGALENEVTRSVSGVAALRDAWEALGPGNISVDPDFFLGLVTSRPSVERPHIVTLRRGGQPVAMLVARVERLPIVCRVGYLTLWRPLVRSIVVSHDGLVGEESTETAAAVLECLRRSVADHEAEAVYMPSLRVDSPLYRAASTSRGALRARRAAAAEIHHRLTLPATLDDFLASLSSKSRGTVRRYARRLETSFEGRLELRVLRHPAEIDTVFRDATAVSARTYHAGLGVALEDTPAQRRLTTLAMEHGRYSCYVLYLNGEPAAFWEGTAYAGVFRSGFTGYDPAFAEYRLGTYILTHIVDDMCRDPAVDCIDFGVGEAEYKRRFSNVSWQDADLLLLGRAPRTRIVGSVRTLTGAANDGARAALERYPRLRGLKREWRERLSGAGRRA